MRGIGMLIAPVRILKIYFQSLFLALCLGVVSCSHMPDELKQAEALVEVKPDSALMVLQSIRPEKLNGEASKACFRLLWIEAHVGLRKPVSQAQIDTTLQYYEQADDQIHLVRCYFCKGRSLKYAFKYEQAVNWYLKAAELLADSKDEVLQARVNFDLGDIYSIQRDYKLARVKYDLAYHGFVKTGTQSQAFYSHLNIGRTYQLSKKYEFARTYFQRMMPEAKDSLLQAALWQEIGVCYYQSNQFEKALQTFRNIKHYPYLGNNRALRYYYLADIHFSMNHTDSALYYAGAALEYQPDIRTQRECYRILTNCEYLLSHLPKMSEYMNCYVHLGDSLRIIDAQTRGSYIETMHSAKAEARKKQGWLWYLGGALLLVLAMATLLYLRKHRKSKLDLQLTEANHQEQKAGIHKEVLLKHRDALLAEIDARKAAHTDEWKKAGPAERARIDRSMYEELLHLNDLNFFYKEMNTVLNNLVTKLQSRYNLNDKEIQWCCLFLLNVSGQDMMLLLDYSPEGLKKMRQRLAKNKFKIDSLKDLEHFLFTLLTE